MATFLHKTDKSFKSASFEAGFAIVELIMSIGIVSVVLIAFVVLSLQAIRVNRVNTANLRAELYLREMIEAAKDLEQTASSWVISGPFDSCESPAICHPVISSNAWVLTPGEEDLGERFRRSMTLSKVCRDVVTNEIALCDGSNPVDPGALKVSGIIMWFDGFTDRSMILEAILYND